ncbi:hypothetical protein BSPWISOXPB_5770 [uncultured Gammaproteobacteria bacterium]|nr:hypothetical protein BSPWISOXPB_5770 [uncultured Gammaproteobacteria bacterium]
MKHRKTKDSDKETTITAEEYAQILKNAAETAQVAEQTGSKYDIDKAAYYAQLAKDAAAKVHEKNEKTRIKKLLQLLRKTHKFLKMLLPKFTSSLK